MTFGFYSKKIISMFLMPIGLISLLLIISLWFFNKRSHLSRIFLISGLVLLIVCSHSGVKNVVTASLEHRYDVNNNVMRNDCYIHVLGNDHDEDIAGPATLQLNRIALARLTEGLRQIKLAKHSVQCVLILSGSKFYGGQIAHAQVMENAARELGYKGKTIKLTNAFDTFDEAQLLKEKGISSIRLVTSALHMHRSMLIFKKSGIQAQAAPADFLTGRTVWWRFNARNISQITEAWHEYVGLAWLTLRGKI